MSDFGGGGRSRDDSIVGVFYILFHIMCVFWCVCMCVICLSMYIDI